MKPSGKENFGPEILRVFISLVFLILAGNACVATQPSGENSGPETVTIPAGKFVFGSDPTERDYAYNIDQAAYGHTRTRDAEWYEQEPERQNLYTDLFQITTTPVTNHQYQEFVNATGHPAPAIDRTTWKSYGLVHPFDRTIRHSWKKNQPPTGREHHPVVLVSYNDATSYAAWLSERSGYTWRLPTEIEWVKAARGPDGWRFPWGNDFDASKLNSHDNGPFDTVEVGSSSPPNVYGVLDASGQVFEWIHQSAPNAQRAWVKGGSWDDKGCGVCRPAARHSRPVELKHILIGFRLIKE